MITHTKSLSETIIESKNISFENQLDIVFMTFHVPSTYILESLKNVSLILVGGSWV